MDWIRRRSRRSPHATATASHALSFRYGQRHSVELDAAARRGRTSSASPSTSHPDRPAGVRRLGADRRHRRAEGPDADDDIGNGIPVTYVPARNTIFLSFALAWAEVLGAADIFIGVNALDYSGYPDCRPEYIAAYETHGQPRHRRPASRAQRADDPHPADRPDQGRDHPAGHRRSASTTRMTVSCYDPDDGPARVRAVRLVPAPAQGLRRGRASRTRRAYRAASRGSGMTLPGQGDLLHPPGRGHPRRTPRGVLPVHRLQPVDRPRGAPVDAVCQFCDTDFVGTDGPGGGTLRHRRRPGRRRRPAAWAADDRRRPTAFVVCTGGEPLLQLDEPAGRRAARPRASRSPIETNGTRRRARRHRLDLRQPEGRRRARRDRRRRTEARLPAGRRSTPTWFETSTSSTASSSRWTAPTARRTPPRPSSTASTHPHWRLSLQTHKYLGIP